MDLIPPRRLDLDRLCGGARRGSGGAPGDRGARRRHPRARGRALALGLALASVVPAAGPLGARQPAPTLRPFLQARGQPAPSLPPSLQARVDSVFAFVEPGAPGCALGVSRGGTLIYGRGYGLANLEWQIPITTATVFDIGSVSKQFTAAAVALLEMDGVLALDDDVRRWIPEMPDYGAPVTLRHLLHHTSGVRDYLTLLNLAGFDLANVFDEQDGVRLITRQRALNFPPGTEYLYSNSGYLLLAHVVRRATGRSLRDFLTERVFLPLGMTHTSVWDRNTEVLPQRATGYAPVAGGGWRINHAWNFQMGGDGQVITSVEDLARWDANFYEPKVGGVELLERLHRRGVLATGDTIPYALGLSLDRYRGVPRVQHGGSWAGFRAMLARYPEQRTSIMVLCNRSDANPSAYAAAVADLVLADAFPEPPPARAGAATPSTAAPPPPAGAGPETPAPPALTPAQLLAYAGSYWSDEIEAWFQVAVEGEVLVLRRSPGGAGGPSARALAAPGVPLRPAGPDTFRGPALTLTFLRDGEGAPVTALSVEAGRVRGIVFRRMAGGP